jgi:hypothetical protein
MTHRPPIDDPPRATSYSYMEVLVSSIALIGVFVLISLLVEGYYRLAGPPCPDPESVVVGNIWAGSRDAPRSADLDGFENARDKADALAGLGAGGGDASTAQSTPPTPSAIQQVQACGLPVESGARNKPSG